MPLALALLLISHSQPTPLWRLDEVVEMPNVIRGGRIPFSRDLLLTNPVVTQGAIAKRGQVVLDAAGNEHKWTGANAKDGVLAEQPPAGYVQAVYDSPTEQSAILTATGDSAVYVNGELRPGDVYGTGYLSLPVHLKSGPNTLLFVSGRGSLGARLEPPVAPQQLSVADMTLPDVLPTDTGTLQGGVVVLNSTGQVAHHLKLEAFIGDQQASTILPDVLPYSLRKVPFRFPVVAGTPGTKQTVTLVLNNSTTKLDSNHVDVSLADPKKMYRRTFISQIDGSLQYYAVDPAQRPSGSNALVLTLHGAGVEASGQAAAYQPKDWCTIVAPTNRRPYGFDWEDIGRLDALEVLNIAKKSFPHDPERVVLTGHSMGGHGTWSIGTLYPDLFAAIAPSAGWVSFTSYAGGFSPATPTKLDNLFLAAQSPSDTLARVRNTLSEHVYILHGDADDNVPVTEARTMKAALTTIHADFEYHEQPGAGHWWGNQCVDWPPLFDLLKSSRLKPEDDATALNFTTPNPQVSSQLRWITVWQQIRAGESHVVGSVSGPEIALTTTNVQALEIRKPKGTYTLVVVDGQSMEKPVVFPLRLIREGGTWKPVKSWNLSNKSPLRSGPFKQAFQNQMVFVYGTHGTPDENRQMLAAGRYENESLYYRGNGAVDVITDDEYLAGARHRRYRSRNVVLIGNETTNSAWATLLKGSPLQVKRGEISGAGRLWTGSQFATLICRPLAGADGAMVAAFGCTGTEGLAAIQRLPIFFSGPAYPDWTVFDASKTSVGGISGVEAAGNFGPNWKLNLNDSAFR